MFSKNFLIADGLHKLQHLLGCGCILPDEMLFLQSRLFQKPKKTHRMIQSVFWWKYLLDSAQIGQAQFDDLKRKLLS